MNVTKVINAINTALLENHLHINTGYTISCNPSHIEVKLPDFQITIDLDDKLIYVSIDKEWVDQSNTGYIIHLSFNDRCKPRYFDWFFREGIYQLRTLVDAMNGLPSAKINIVNNKFNNLFINENQYKVHDFVLRLGECSDFGDVPITAFVEIDHNCKHRYYIDLTESQETNQVEFLKLADIVK